MPFVVGIAGGTGAGKSTLVRLLEKRFSGQVSVLRMDDYYHDVRHRDPQVSSEGSLSFDTLDAVDLPLLAEHIDALRAGQSVDAPVYDFSTHQRRSDTNSIDAADLVLVEGIMVLAAMEIRQRIDLSVFVELDADLRLIRRLRRDVNERGRSTESVLAQWEASVKPFHDAAIQPSSQHADLVVSGSSFERFSELLRIISVAQD